ncbi:hypothetical protein GF386_03325 [Candidatus Pacearchaeota archaeon]|nr:hypothetical protein [Candidatus Pacearchaeota archaeon]MBD3283171.1 hypothetical protein [Candidatus Pacearchaeota archaeon]
MIEPEIIKKIEDFVYKKPRSIQEISSLIQKNWRTADRYIEHIKKNFGTLDIRIFREGTRGALKIVYWASLDKASSSVFQEELEKNILAGKIKYDFAGFDIFQHVPKNKKHAWIKKGKDESDAGRLREFEEILLKSEKQILFFSGNLSFVNFDDGETNVFNVIEKLVKKGIPIKVVCRVDIGGKENIEKLLSINYKYGKELIEIKHREQPLRITIIDDKLANIKEVKEPTGRDFELNKKTFIFYTLTDKDWISWLTRIFWKMFSTSIDAKKRLEEMEKIKKY